jgi:hypothetical protein
VHSPRKRKSLTGLLKPLNLLWSLTLCHRGNLSRVPQLVIEGVTDENGGIFIVIEGNFKLGDQLFTSIIAARACNLFLPHVRNLLSTKKKKLVHHRSNAYGTQPVGDPMPEGSTAVKRMKYLCIIGTDNHLISIIKHPTAPPKTKLASTAYHLYKWVRPYIAERFGYWVVPYEGRKSRSTTDKIQEDTYSPEDTNKYFRVATALIMLALAYSNKKEIHHPDCKKEPPQQWHHWTWVKCMPMTFPPWSKRQT